MSGLGLLTPGSEDPGATEPLSAATGRRPVFAWGVPSEQQKMQTQSPNEPHGWNPRAPSPESRHSAHFANGSGRTWNFITLLVVPFPVSMWKGVRVLTVAHSPLPFHPAFGLSMRPSSHFV
jgi:hypothetical protein